MGSGIPLTPPRAREADRRQPLIIVPVRRDITDYGPPGSHLTGPWARTKNYTPLAFPGLVGPDGEEAEAQPVCPLLDGDATVLTPAVGAGVTTVQLSQRIMRPFVVTHVQYWSDNTIPDSPSLMGLGLMVSDDNDTTGGFNTTGRALSPGRAGIAYEPFNQTQQEFPNYVEWGSPKFLKGIFRNLSAGTLQGYVSISWRYLR